MTQKIIMLRGLPASGKTTTAREWMKKDGNLKRINRDELRAMVDNGSWSGKKEAFMFSLRDAFVKEAIRSGYNVIVDDTNLRDLHFDGLQRVTDVLKKEGFNLELRVEDSFLEVSLEECIKRDRLREYPVGSDVIFEMYVKHVAKPVKMRSRNRPAFICDIDGTLSIAPEGANPYERDFTRDMINHKVKEIVMAMLRGGYVGIFVSGRNNTYFEETAAFLNAHIRREGFAYELYMRDAKDNRPDYIVKKEILEKYILERYYVHFVIDDRPQVIRMWRSLGIFVFDVNQRGIEF